MATSELDIEQRDQLIAYLRTARHIDADETPVTTVLAGGVSNRTVFVRRTRGEAWVLKQALAKLRVNVDWFSDPARVHREALGMRWLKRLAPNGTITDLVFEDRDHHLLAMAAVPEPHENWRTMLLDGRLDVEHVEQFARLLAAVHRESHAQRDELAAVFEDRGFFESLRLEPYYAYSAEQAPEAAAFLRALIDDTRRHRLTLVHGDYSPKNILVHDGRLVLLDHEVIHFGDPAFDLGFSTTHLLSKAHHLPELRKGFAEAAKRYWAGYREALGDVPWTDDFEPRAVRQTLGCLLARVVGRSQLEYMSDEEKARQREAVIGLVGDPPMTMTGLADRLVEWIDSRR